MGHRHRVRKRAALALGLSFAFAACGKSTSPVEGSGGSAGTRPDPSEGSGGEEPTATGGTSGTPSVSIGEPCSQASQCAAPLACALGTCRTDCRTDADCPRGSLCSGTSQPYGCSLPAELECASSSDCPEPLVCGPDAKCRVACEVSDDCPRNDHSCRTGVCVGNDDPDPRWFECEDGETVCENYVTNENCHEAGFPPSCYRRMGCRLDGMNWGLIETCSPGYCYYQADLQGRLSSACQ